MGKRILKSLYFILGICVALISGLALALYKLAGWVMETWGGLSIDEIIFHLKVPLEGTNMDVVIDGINRCVPIAVVMFLMMTAVLIGMKQKKKLTIICMFLVMSLSIGTTVKAAYNMYEELDVEKYLKNQKQESELIQKNYVDPRSVSITFPEKREI